MNEKKKKKENKEHKFSNIFNEEKYWHRSYGDEFMKKNKNMLKTKPNNPLTITKKSGNQ